MKSPLLNPLLCIMIVGCHVGPQIEDFEQARRPEGITTSIELRDGIFNREHIEGELLEVRKDGLLLNANDKAEGPVVKRYVVFVPYTTMANVKLDKVNLSVLDNTNKRNPSAASSKRLKRDRDTLRLLSRFPQGLSRPLLDELMAAEGQTAVDVIDGESMGLSE